MNPLALAVTDRRGFLAQLTLAGIGVAGACFPPAARTAEAGSHSMKPCLAPGSIGVRANQTETIALAHRHGFAAVEPFPDFLAGLSSAEMAELRADLEAKGLVWGAAGLPVEFRRDDGTFNEGLSRLSSLAAALQRAGAKRVGTWLSPGHGSLTYRRNFDQHARRLGEVSRVLADHGLRLGLEYVGTFTSRARQRFPFVHNLAETRELIAAIGGENTGVVLDSWHWWQAGDSEADLLALAPDDIVSVDLNDAPAGLAKDQQQDGKRELPAATGVIDVATFLRALVRIGYAGPVRAEPFNQALNALDNDAACATTLAALRKAFGGVSP